MKCPNVTQPLRVSLLLVHFGWHRPLHLVLEELLAVFFRSLHTIKGANNTNAEIAVSQPSYAFMWYRMLVTCARLVP